MTTQTEQTKKPRGRRPAVSISERIAEAEKHLATLKEQARREERENLEKNRKAISDLFKTERLDTVDVEQWRKVLPKLKALVGMAASSASESPAADKGASVQQQPAAQAA